MKMIWMLDKAFPKKYKLRPPPPNLFQVHHSHVRFSPLPVLTVAGLKAFQTMVSQMLVAMKREIPEPRP